MVMVWVSSSFCYYMISFQLKYLQGSIWINGTMSSISEVIAYGTSGMIFNYLGLKLTIYISYTLSIIGMICLIIFPNSSQLLLALYILGSKYGVAQTFNAAYVGNQYLFTLHQVSSTFAIGNFFARFTTIFAPYIAELKPETISQWVFVGVTAAAFLSSLFIVDTGRGRAKVTDHE